MPRGTWQVLVNGMSEPIVTLAARRWYRFRMVFAAVDSVLEPSLTGCEVKLLAKDGIYLHDAPRDITLGYMGCAAEHDHSLTRTRPATPMHCRLRVAAPMDSHCPHGAPAQTHTRHTQPASRCYF
jgi:hypothetical protein